MKGELMNLVIFSRLSNYFRTKTHSDFSQGGPHRCLLKLLQVEFQKDPWRLISSNKEKNWKDTPQTSISKRLSWVRMLGNVLKQSGKSNKIISELYLENNVPKNAEH